MPIVHFLNVRQGDCTLIQHGSGRITMIDVNNARAETEEIRSLRKSIGELTLKVAGNFNQKAYPENPIDYMRERGMDGLFRFILTHPDMDHMDGIADIWDVFSPPNFWDTAHTCDKDNDDWDAGPYRKEDWDFYKTLRGSASDPKHLIYHSGQPACDFWGKDGLCILSPTPTLVATANDCGEWNDSSYVVLYTTKSGFRAIFAGDSHDGTWEHILEHHSPLVKDVDLLAAPHHGRHSDRDFAFLDVLKPKLTLFGNAPSEHLAYNAWNSRGLPIVTNNQAGSIVVDFESEYGSYYVTNEKYAGKTLGEHTFYSSQYKAWLAGFVRS